MLVAALQEVVDQRGEDIYDQERIERLQEYVSSQSKVEDEVRSSPWFIPHVGLLSISPL